MSSSDDEGYELIPQLNARRAFPFPLPGASHPPPGPSPTSTASYSSGPPTPLTPHTPSVVLPSVVRSPPGIKDPPPLPPPNPGGRKFNPIVGKPSPAVRSPGHVTEPHPTAGSRKSGPPPPPRVKSRSKTIAYSTEHNAPPIPPKPLPKSISYDEGSPRKRKRRTSQDYILLSDELTLNEFVEQYQDSFPVSVRVCKGFYGPSERTSVSEGDSFNIHFVKKSRVVNMDDSQSFSFKIALNSAIEFGLLYDPDDNIQEAQNGYQFEKVSDIFAKRTLPKAIRSTTAWKGSGPDSSVEENELLLVKGIQKKLMGKLLKVYSPTSCKKKELPESCAGNFTTRPYDVKLYLPEIVEHVVSPFPMDVLLFVSAETACELPTYLTSGNVTLRSVSTETSLIATSLGIDGNVESTDLIDIPFDLDIEVQVLTPKDEEETEQLFHNTRCLYEQFNPSQIGTFMKSTTDTQATLYTMVREGNELAGVDLVMPAAVFVSTTNSEDTSSSTPVHPSSTQPFTAPSSSFVQEQLDSLENRVGALLWKVEALESTGGGGGGGEGGVGGEGSNTAKLSRDLMSVRADEKRLENRLSKVLEEISSVKSTLSRLGPNVDYLLQSNQELRLDIKQLQQQITSTHSTQNGSYTSTTSQPPPTPSPPKSKSVFPLKPDEDTLERNKAFLETLDCMKVIQILDAMGLSQYREMFLGEQISGEILLECDDIVLEKELRVSSRLHRVRMMKLISGHHSAEKLLSGEDPYVFARK